MDDLLVRASAHRHACRNRACRNHARTGRSVCLSPLTTVMKRAAAASVCDSRLGLQVSNRNLGDYSEPPPGCTLEMRMRPPGRSYKIYHSPDGTLHKESRPQARAAYKAGREAAQDARGEKGCKRARVDEGRPRGSLPVLVEVATTLHYAVCVSRLHNEEGVDISILMHTLQASPSLSERQRLELLEMCNKSKDHELSKTPGGRIATSSPKAFEEACCDLIAIVGCDLLVTALHMYIAMRPLFTCNRMVKHQNLELLRENKAVKDQNAELRGVVLQATKERDAALLAAQQAGADLELQKAKVAKREKEWLARRMRPILTLRHAAGA